MKVKITQSPDPVPVLCYDSGMSKQHHRRQFVREVASAGAAMVLMSQNQIPMADHQPGVKWQIGCFNRPWTTFTYDQAIDGIGGIVAIVIFAVNLLRRQVSAR